MIRHLTEENTSSSESILRYTLTSTAYQAIGRTVSALFVLEAGVYLLTQKGLLLIDLPLLCCLQKMYAVFATV